MAGPYYTTTRGETAAASNGAGREANAELGSRIVRGMETQGDLVVIERVYALLGTEAAAEIINICRNYPEMRFVPHLSAVIAENPGTALVIDIGDDLDADGYADGMVLSSGGTVLFSAGTSVRNQDPVITTDDGTQGDWIYATVVTATTLTAAAELRFFLVFAVNS